ncbi:hypothetical protein QCM8_256 [Bacillus phage QCM8]|nr:hypothetical protein QCM8_256 [Bacillus phage QCM8]
MKQVQPPRSDREQTRKDLFHKFRQVESKVRELRTILHDPTVSDEELRSWLARSDITIKSIYQLKAEVLEFHKAGGTK